MARARDAVSYAFTDPLGGADPLATRRRIRHGHVLIYGAAVPSLLLALLTDGGPLAQRLATGAAMVMTALVATVLLVWHRAPDRLLLAAFPLAGLTVTAIALLDPPLALTPMFYVWPLMTAAYFLKRPQVIVTYGVVCASFGAAVLWGVDDGPRVMEWATVVVVGAVVVAFVGALRGGMVALVGRLNVLAQEDPLTGALNRRALMEHLDAELCRARLAGACCAVAVVDVDHFKAINDDFGHAAGDAALRGLVGTIAGGLRDGDAIGRLGGEEFAILLADADAHGAESYADRLRVLVAERAATSGTPFTVSVGVAAWTGTGGAEDLLATADAALYHAKRTGRDMVCVA